MQLKIRLSTLLFLLLSSIISPTLFGIAHYRAIPLTHILDEPKESCISFSYRIFNKTDCRKYLGRQQIIAKGYQPIQIQLTNNSNRTLVLSPNNFSIPCKSYDLVADQVYFNTTGRLIGWAIGSLFIWPLIVVFILEAIESPKANEQLNADFLQKSLSNQIIAPFSSINGLIFVSTKQFNPLFSFTVTDVKTHESFTLSTIHRHVKVE